MSAPCPHWLLLGADPDPHDCGLWARHEGAHHCSCCDLRWDDEVAE